MKRSIKKGTFAVLFLLLNACTQTCKCWDYEQTITPCCRFNSARVATCPHNIYRDMQLEIIRNYFDTRTYLNIFCLYFPSEQSEPSKTLITISSEDESYSILADRLEGGQKLLLPNEVANDIFCRLINGESLIISAGRHRANLSPTGFSKVYFKLENFNK